MQKWCPDDFSTAQATVEAVVHGEDPSFDVTAFADSGPVDDKSRLFMSETGFSAPQAIMNHLTQEERNQVFELVEQDVAREYETKLMELKAAHEEDLQLARKEFEKSLVNWGQGIQEALESHLKETADSAARLAVQLAEKMVRAKAAADTGVLVRALEVCLFKLEGSRSVSVNVHPDQAAWLGDQPELLAKLGIENVVADRRVETGGCLVRTEKKEWDATIKGQLQILSELVEEMTATGDLPTLAPEGSGDVAQPLA